MIRISLLALALCSLVTACGDDGGGDGGVNCDTSTLTYANFGEQFMESQCLECHSVDSVDRKSAPASVNFDNLAEVQTQAGRIKSRVNAGTMPPASAMSTPSQAERNDLVEWIDCGLK